MKSILKIALLLLSLMTIGCKKDFLDERPNKALLVPSTIKDMQALLDNNGVMNVWPVYTILASDNITSTNPLLGAVPKAVYTWSADIWIDEVPQDWNRPWVQIFYSNVILDELIKNEDRVKTDPGYNSVKGAAYFFRAVAYYNLLQQFAKPYSAATSMQELGMPIRLISDVNQNPPRPKLEESYTQVISDLNQASSLLPVNVLFKTRPSKTAALAMLARVYLSMSDYRNAADNASNALALNNNLLDINTLNASAAKPFPQPLAAGNSEVIFFARAQSATLFTDLTTAVPDSLYNSYSIDDLRKTVFFNTAVSGRINFKGSLTGNGDNFQGLANDELFLIRSECYARLDQTESALLDLNNLLIKRFKLGKFLPIAIKDKKLLLQEILKERNKELLFRGTRWTDLRRLNLIDNLGYRLTRVYGGSSFTLEPNSRGYVFPIPQNETNLSGIR